MFVAVGGNYQSTNILDLDTMTWRDGPAPGDWYDNVSSAPFGDTFVVVGGTNSDAIYEFDPENEEWIQREQTLSEERKDTGNVFVKNNIVNCS